MRSGIVTVVGRPNVGKSSLINALVGQKVAIVSHKPQTTRHRIQGVLHHEQGQIVFVDTPGLHRVRKTALNRVMNEAAEGAVGGVDLILFVIESGRFTEEDENVLTKLAGTDTPVGLIINKVDRVTDKEKLLPELEKRSALREFAFVMPLSAQKKTNLKPLVEEIFKRLPEGDPLYPDDMVVGHDESFGVAELIREKLTRTLHQELPYALTVQIEEFKREGRLDRISAVVWVERESQKKIVIGLNGGALKLVGSAARTELERQTGRKVFLKVWCKVRENWSDDVKALKSFGIIQE